MAVATLAAALLGLVPSFHLVLSDGNSQLQGGRPGRRPRDPARFPSGTTSRSEGVFMDHVGRSLLAHASFKVSAETRDALAATSQRRSSNR